MKYARISNDKVAEVIATDPAGRFHPSIIWVACDDEVEVGYGYADGVFSAPDQSIDVSTEDVRAEARRRLQSTDWYVTRMAETGETIPQTISDYRAAVRTASNSMEPSPPLNYRDDSHWPEVID